MEVRGERECQTCGFQWSYYETGDVTCPACGSLKSVGLDEPTEHTASDAELDLTAVRNAIEEDSLANLTDNAITEARTYLRRVGFIDAGQLQPLDNTFLLANELRRVASTVGRRLRVDDEEKLYFYELLRVGDQGERPPPAAVPGSLSAERSLAVAASLDIYLGDIRRVYDGGHDGVDRVLSTVRTHCKRIDALDGAVEPVESEQLVQIVRDVSAFLRNGEEQALAQALERIDSLQEY